jgi:dCMP deaminase
MMENDHCIATVHAEANAIIQAAKNGVSVNGADIYVTASPCWHCFKLIANSGIQRIFYGEFYRDQHVIDIAKKTGIELKQVKILE